MYQNTEFLIEGL